MAQDYGGWSVRRITGILVEERLQNIHIPNHLYNNYGLARRHQSVLQKPGRLMAKDGSQKDSRSDKEGFNKEDRVQGIRFRQLFYQDID